MGKDVETFGLVLVDSNTIKDAVLNSDIAKPPYSPTRVEVQIVLNNIGQIDLIEGTVDLKLEISMNWRDPRIKSSDEAGSNASIWRPAINVFNRSPDATVTLPSLFFRDGVCGYDVTYCVCGVRCYVLWARFVRPRQCNCKISF